MEQKTIIFYTKNGTPITVKLKAFISADMIVEMTRILRKYVSKSQEFINNLDGAKAIEDASYSDADYLRAKKVVNIFSELLKTNSKYNEYELAYTLYEDEMNREIIPLIVVNDISNKEIKEMLSDSDSALWGSQDVMLFRGICEKVRP